ncbi:arylsulfatase [Halomarina rubra]|uniref:Arylsulfatase n=1 Tax=Halomarina rubra TaxID=2071873 RepID=A0ABD6ARE7_9EURY|nr:arylsulfatase [Halomarina rubra]
MASDHGNGRETAPNIVLVMADDMGYSDIGCYGSEIQTPTLDGLAADGQRFTQFYNCARCCPTRASLLTGQYPHKAGMGWMTAKDLGTQEYAGDLNDQCVTIPEVLSEQGYATYMSGKWHLTRSEYVAADASKHNWPLQRGFDRFYGTISGANNYFSPSDLTRGNDRLDPPEEGYYYTDAISDEAAQFVRDHDADQADDPFFLYVAYTAPHWPLNAKAEDIERYEAQYLAGWDDLRQARYERLIEEGIIDSAWPLSLGDSKDWADLDTETKEQMARKMAIYAAQVDAMDQGIGRLVDTLSETGQLDDTLFLFLSDNGGCAEGGPYGWDGPMGAEAEAGHDMTPISSYGRYWANLSNTPFRRYKHWVHEGGIATPLIAHWPNGIVSDSDLITDVGHVVDVMATCLDVAEATYPDHRNGTDIRPLDGTSLWPAFDGEGLDRKPLFWEHEANRAVRTDRWKLVSKGENGRWELYDMDADRTELDDRSAEFPDIVEDLGEQWEAFAERIGAYPLDGRTHHERMEETSEHLEH